jgi:hypothetical protein
MFHASGADEDGIFTLQVPLNSFLTGNFQHHCDSRSQARFPGMAAATAASHNEENVAVSMSKVSSANNLLAQQLIHVQTYSTGAVVDCIAFTHQTGIFGLWGSGKSRGFYRGCAVNSPAAAEV